MLLMEEILHELIGSLSHYSQGFIHPGWCRISSINRMAPKNLAAKGPWKKMVSQKKRNLSPPFPNIFQVFFAVHLNGVQWSPNRSRSWNFSSSFVLEKWGNRDCRISTETKKVAKMFRKSSRMDPQPFPPFLKWWDSWEFHMSYH